MTRALGAAQAAYEVIRVPGALEIPQAIALALDAQPEIARGVIADLARRLRETHQPVS